MGKICSRCKSEFECHSNAIEFCNCTNITLSEETLHYLKKTSYDCLCTNCLEEIEQYKKLKNEFPFPQHPSQYKEGVHYYLEGQYWVFTNFYHYLKGSCCKNNCRHCAYGYSL